MDESIQLVKMTRLRMGKSVHRWEVVIPAFVRLRIFTPLCFGSCMYLSSSEAYTNNWGLFGKENYLTFDWWKHFLKILRHSEVTINLTRRLKKMEASEFAPLQYYIVFFCVFFRTHLTPVHLTCRIAPKKKKDFQLSGMHSQYSKREQKIWKDIHNL